MSALGRGDLPPRVLVTPPGPQSRALSAQLALAEAPGINTLHQDRPALLWEQARGANVLDVDGNRFIDLTAGFGVAAVGHRHPRVVRAVRRQSARLLHGLADVHAHPGRVELALRLVELAPFPDAQVHFALSGAEAVEVALKTAALVTGRPGVLAFHGGYHGLTLGALAVTSRPSFREPFRAQLNPHVQHLDFGADEPTLRRVLSGGSVGCVVVEPVQGREGVVVAPAGWLARLAALCRESHTLLVADEILTGFGRTGTQWAVDGEELVPDLLCCGKALGGGLPVSAVLGRRELMAVWKVDGEARHTTTFLAQPLACAAALAVLEVMAREHLVARSARLGKALGRRLARWPARFPDQVETVRGRGLFWGVVLRDAAKAAAFTAAALQRGVILLAGGPEGRVAQLVPPLVVRQRQLDVALDLLEEALATGAAPAAAPAATRRGEEQ